MITADEADRLRHRLAGVDSLSLVMERSSVEFHDAAGRVRKTTLVSYQPGDPHYAAVLPQDRERDGATRPHLFHADAQAAADAEAGHVRVSSLAAEMISGGSVPTSPTGHRRRRSSRSRRPARARFGAGRRPSHERMAPGSYAFRPSLSTFPTRSCEPTGRTTQTSFSPMTASSGG